MYAQFIDDQKLCSILKLQKKLCPFFEQPIIYTQFLYYQILCSDFKRPEKYLQVLIYQKFMNKFY